MADCLDGSGWKHLRLEMEISAIVETKSKALIEFKNNYVLNELICIKTSKLTQIIIIFN